jgi:hypothetical protein
MGKHVNSVDSQVLARISRKGKGWVFTPSDFLDLGSRRAVGLALMRHTKDATIRKLARGLYDYPRQDRRAGAIAASTQEIANAMKGRDKSTGRSSPSSHGAGEGQVRAGNKRTQSSVSSVVLPPAAAVLVLTTRSATIH